MRILRALVPVLLWLPVAAVALPDGLQPVAEARACYAGLFKLYEAQYLRAPAAAEARCVRLSYLRGFSAAELDEATQKVLARRHGEDWLERYRSELAAVGAAYQAVEPGDSYSYCIEPGAQGVLRRDGREVLRLDSPGFAESFMQIWVLGEDAAQRPQWNFRQC